MPTTVYFGLSLVIYQAVDDVWRALCGFFQIPARRLSRLSLYLFLGIILWNFFAEATTSAMCSIVEKGVPASRLPAEATVTPLASSMTWAYMLLRLRNTHNLGLPGVPTTLALIRACLLFLAMFALTLDIFTSLW